MKIACFTPVSAVRPELESLSETVLKLNGFSTYLAGQEGTQRLALVESLEAQGVSFQRAHNIATNALFHAQVHSLLRECVAAVIEVHQAHPLSPSDLVLLGLAWASNLPLFVLNCNAMPWDSVAQHVGLPLAACHVVEHLQELPVRLVAELSKSTTQRQAAEAQGALLSEIATQFPRADLPHAWALALSPRR